ncbi:porin family protein [Tellurirhabdus bombi]|uniref:porin family protein n=1 Tax=Tellurirhabdus bombi TaxID=2907205 RepID=UPI001F416136|nr:porin family protein [Tellurirhabdus bombi]
MKRGVIMIVGLLSLTISSVFAQQRWSAGPRLGLNLSTAVGAIDNTKLAPGLAVGGFIMYSDVNHFGVSADVLYSQRGFRFDQANQQGTYKYRQRVDYLEVPVLFRYFMNRSGNFRPNLFLGPNLGLMIGADRTSPDVKNKELFRNAELGATVGLSFNFRVRSAQRLHIDARYTLGLTDFTYDKPGYINSPDNINNGTVRNSTFQLLLGYGFGVGRSY